MNNLFVVASPFQTLSAFEAINRFSQSHEEKSCMVIYFGENRNQNEQIKSVIELLHQAFDVDYLFIEYRNSWGYFLSKLKIIKKLSKLEIKNLFVGHLREYSNRLFITNINFQNLYSLDDGAATLTLDKEISSKNYFIDCHPLFNIGTLIKKMVCSGYGLADRKKVEVNWFSMFSFSPKNRNDLIQHSFELLQSFRTNVTKQNEEIVYFVGANLVNAGVLKSVIVYQEMLTEVFGSINSSKRIIYLPHRFEDVSELSELFNQFNISVLKLTDIIEIFCVKNGVIPTDIISFYSTALFSLKKIFPETNVSYKKIPIEYVETPFKKGVDTIQSYYNTFFKSI
ncbi:glycosyltransferase family 52 [Sphingobacterium gobiense]|uniref:Uncharacterized protein n=1 Tax=Sphingobacterium gobiense TaxID=1382456 RepID=A0A2S9JGA4_9SPHI|nr:glycosyltransferase family 52 [Sphingobacterium gobiense]PRD51948.1 hypothetical protein C5749_16750 [Sphingobacterium gobiense]